MESRTIALVLAALLPICLLTLGSPESEVQKQTWDAHAHEGHFVYKTGNHIIRFDVYQFRPTVYSMIVHSEPPFGTQSSITADVLRETLRHLQQAGCDIRKISSVHLPHVDDDDLRQELTDALYRSRSRPEEWSNDVVLAVIDRENVFKTYIKIFDEFNLVLVPYAIEKTLLLPGAKGGRNSKNASPDIYFHVRPR